MNPGKWKVNLSHRIFILYKSAAISLPISLPCKGPSVLVFVTYGTSFYLPVRSVQPPIQSLYSRVRCIYMLERSVHSLIPILYPWVFLHLHARTFCTLADTISIPVGAMYLKKVLFTRWYDLIPICMLYLTCMGNFYMRAQSLYCKFYPMGTNFYCVNRCLALR